jgi:hypothetical protein
VILGYPEKEVWNMTFAKIVALYKEHQKELGLIPSRELTIDDIIP